MKRKWDNYSVLKHAVDTAKEEGIQEGMEKERVKAEAEKRKSAVALKKLGMPAKDIAKALGLSAKEVEKL